MEASQGVLAKGAIPKGFIYTTIMELGPNRPSLLWFWGSNSIMAQFIWTVFKTLKLFLRGFMRLLLGSSRF